MGSSYGPRQCCCHPIECGMPRFRSDGISVAPSRDRCVRANSRTKDFYDIWLLSQPFPFDDDRLARGIAATFERRETRIPVSLPDALSPAFAEDERKWRQWNAILENVALRPASLPEVIEGVAGFIMPHAIAAAKLGRSD